MINVVVCLLILSFSSLAAKWNQLSLGESYFLTQNFQLTLMDRSDLSLDFRKGDKFKLKEITSIDIPGAPINLLTFEYKNCPGMDAVTDLEIIEVKGSTPLVEVGAEVVACELLFYLERKDLFNKSLFE